MHTRVDPAVTLSQRIARLDHDRVILARAPLTPDLRIHLAAITARRDALARELAHVNRTDTTETTTP